MRATRPMFPMCVTLHERSCVVVGAGSVAASKAESLLNCGARLVIVAPHACDVVRQLIAQRSVDYRAREFRPGDLDGAFLVVAATSDRAVNDAVWQEAKARHVLCNVVDDPARCDFFYPAVVQRGALQIAISTGGIAPALARRLRLVLEEQFGPEYAEWLEHVAERRREIIASVADADQRRRLIDDLTSENAYRNFVERTSKRCAGETK